VRGGIVSERYARRVRSAAERNAAILTEIEALPVKERLAGMALYHSTCEGVLHPERSEEGELVFSVPEFIRTGVVKVPRPFPLPCGADAVTASVREGVELLRALIEEAALSDDSDLEEGDESEEDDEADCRARNTEPYYSYDSDDSQSGDDSDVSEEGERTETDSLMASSQGGR
jgi:hypothetical protein